MKLQKINLSKNKQSEIYGNQIGIINNFYNTELPHEVKIDLQLRNSGKFNELFENKKVITSPILRHETENLKLEKLIKLSQLYNFKPVLRIYGCFSSLGTIRQKSDTSDLAQLELQEKNNVIEFIKNNYETKVIISLDMHMIFSNNVYTIEQYNERCKDLINTLEYLKKYKNLKIAIDNENNMESMYIFDTILICSLPTLLFNNNLITYNEAIYDSELGNILKYINIFEKRFNQLRRNNIECCKMINCKNEMKLLEFISKSKRINFFNQN